MPRPKPEGEGDFHVVGKHVCDDKGRAIRGKSRYQVYCNNVPFLKGAGTELTRREAQWIAGILNERFKRIGGRNLVKKAAA